MDQIFRLLLDTGMSAPEAERVARKIDEMGMAARKTADTYEVLSTVLARSSGAVGTYEIATDRMNVALDAQVRKAVEATQAKRALAMALDDMPHHTAVAAAGVDALTGKPGNVGFGIAGASYAVQDFITVVSMGGGWGRAMLSMANNVTPVVMSLGLGAGLAGAIGFVVTAASAGVSSLEAWWKAADSDKADSAKQKLEEMQAEIRKTSAEFKKLAETPTDYEKMAAEGIGLFLQQKPNAERARKAVGAGLTAAEFGGKIDMKAFREVEREATRTDEQLLDEGHIRARALYGSEVTQDVIDEEAERYRKEGAARRTEALRRRTEMVEAARKAKAEEIVTQATVAGPAGDAARKKLMDLSRFAPGMEELQGYTPERLRAEDEEFERSEAAGEPGSDLFAERARKGTRSQRKHAQFRVRLQGEQTDAILKRNAERAKALKAEESEFNASVVDREGPTPLQVKAQRRVLRETGMNLAPAHAVEVGRQLDREARPSIREMRKRGAEEQAATSMQQQIYQQTGNVVDLNTALAVFKRLQDQQGQKLEATLGTLLNVNSGMQRQLNMLDYMKNQAMRGMDQSPMPTGLPR